MNLSAKFRQYIVVNAIDNTYSCLKCDEERALNNLPVSDKKWSMSGGMTNVVRHFDRRHKVFRDSLLVKKREPAKLPFLPVQTAPPEAEDDTIDLVRVF